MSTDDLGGRPGGRRTGLGTISTMVALGSAQAATALAMLLLARRTDTDTFGAFISLYAITTALGALIDFGSSQHHTRELAQGIGRQIHRAWLDRRTMFQLPVGVVTSALAWLAFHDHLPLVAIVGISMQSVAFSRSLGENAAVRALRSSATAEWLVALGNLSMLVAVVVAPSTSVVVVAGVFASGSWLITSYVGAWLVHDQVRMRRSARVRSRRLVNPWQGSSGFGIAAASNAAQGLMIPIAGWVAGVATAAEAGAVGKWAHPILLFAASYAAFMFPHFSAAEDDRAALRQVRSMAAVVVLGTAVALTLFVAARPLVEGLLPEAYSDSVAVLRWSALAAIPALVGQPLMVLLQARHVDEFVAVATATINTSGLAAVAMLAPILGAPAIPIVLLAMQLSATLLWIGRALGLRHAQSGDWEYAGNTALTGLALMDPPTKPVPMRLRRRTASVRRDRRDRADEVGQPQLLGEFDAAASAAFELVVGPITHRRERPRE